MEIEHNTLANELIQGMEIAKQLKILLGSAPPSSPQTKQLLLQGILSSYDNALLILNWNGPSVEQPQAAAQTTAVPESPISVYGSPRNGEFDTGFKDHQEHRDVSKKRKGLPTWKDQVRICPHTGMEGAKDDSFSWRKYGQKGILGAKYPRSYYRCTYRNTQSCWATKQVQRSDDDPALFEITYRGTHTCHQTSRAVVPPASSENQEQKNKKNHNNHQEQQPSEILLNLRANLKVKTEDLDKKDISNPFSFPSAFGCLTNESFSPSFISPATSGSSYFSASPYQMNSFGLFSEFDQTEIISANNSTINSPIVDLDFSIDQVDLDPNFPFNTPGFFS